MYELTGLPSCDLPPKWTTVPLRGVLRQTKDPALVSPGHEYPIIGVRWYGAGAYVKDIVDAETTQATKLYRLAPGLLVYNRLFAWKGSFALLDERFEGTYASGEFPSFVANEGFDIRYYYFYLLQDRLWEYISAESTGATAKSRNRWQEVRLRSLVAPRPPLPDQVAIADAIAKEDGRILSTVRALGASMTSPEGSLAGSLIRERQAMISAAVLGDIDGS